MSANKLSEILVAQIVHCIKYRQSLAILAHVAEQNVASVMGAITRCVAEIDSWGETDYNSYSSFNVAKQSLYLNYNVMIDVIQRTHSHPEHPYMTADVSGYNKVYFDLELNASDPNA